MVSENKFNNATIIFNTSKNEIFQVNENYKNVYRKLKNNFKVEINRKNIQPDVLSQCKIFVLAGSQNKFSGEEFKYLKNFIENGGILFVLLGEGGEPEFNTNINFLLEDYGMTINNDSVIRTQYYKYFHPKECVINGGIVCESMWQFLTKQNIHLMPFDFSDEKMKIQYLYPYGATLNVVAPSNVVMTTGSIAYPFNRPIAGFYQNGKNGKILAIGSGHMFQDKYISEEANMLIWDYFIKILTDDEFNTANPIDFGDIEINDNKLIPDIIFMAEHPKMSLLESMDCNIPDDFKRMFDMRLFSINNDQLHVVIDLYKQLGVQFELLKIIKPQFEIPLPPLELAVFQPIYSDISAPSLELFNLEEAFSSDRVQIAQLANKCIVSAEKSKIIPKERELEYFIIECGRCVGLIQNNGINVSAKEILYELCIQIAKYKKLDRE